MNVELLRGKLAAAVLWAVLLLALSGLPGPAFNQARSASSVRLIMVEAPNCIYCRKWDAEIGKSYAKSDEGHFAPLTRVLRDSPILKDFTPAIFTPTFIVVRGTEEVGRITGYPGHIFFWEELHPILVAAGYPPSTALNKP
jgi:hypothetical protein